MKVLFAASEAHPFIKTGGLGDVMGALPQSLANLGVDARVVIPKYKNIKDELKQNLQFIKWAIPHRNCPYVLKIMRFSFACTDFCIK